MSAAVGSSAVQCCLGAAAAILPFVKGGKGVAYLISMTRSSCLVGSVSEVWLAACLDVWPAFWGVWRG